MNESADEETRGEGYLHRFASVDTDASPARMWLVDHFDAQLARGDEMALSRAQRDELKNLLDSMWWQSAVSGDLRDVPEGSALIQRIVPAAVRAAQALPEGGLVLALYLRNIINYAWSMAWDHSLLAHTISLACTEADRLREESAASIDETSACGWALLGFMRQEFAVETALLTGRLDLVLQIADSAVSHVAPIVDRITGLPHSAGKSALEREAGNELTYYRTVRATAQQARALLADPARPERSTELATIWAGIAAAPFNQMDASELRGHLTAVEVINAARERDWLKVDARVRLMYPFAIPNRPGESPASLISALHDSLSNRMRTNPWLGSHRLRSISRRLNLSDVWQGADSFGREYRGVTVDLDPLTLVDVANETVLERIRPHIQFSELGNHMVVFDLDLEDAPAYRVAEALHLATPVFGDLREMADHISMTTSSGVNLSGLPDVVGELRGLLEALLQEVRTGDHGVGGTAPPVVAREGSFGVLVTVTSASRCRADLTSVPVTNGREVLDLWGAQPLLHPLPSGVASVADWALQDLDTVQRWPLLHLNGELLASNSNMTLLVALTSPQFAVADMESYLSFAHSLHGLFHGWHQRINFFAELIAHLLRQAEALLDQDQPALGTAGDLAVIVRESERTELRLQSFIQSAEAVMLFIESPDLVASPPLRTDLDTILASNGYQRLRSEFTRATHDVLGTRLSPLLDVVHRRMEQSLVEQAQRAEADRQGRLDLILQVASVFFGVIGFSGLAGILQQGHPAWGSAMSWWLIATIVALGGLAVLPVVILTRRAAARNRET